MGSFLEVKSSQVATKMRLDADFCKKINVHEVVGKPTKKTLFRPQDGSKTAPWRLKTAQEDAKTEPKTNKNRSENRTEKRSPARTLLRRSWGDLGPILGSILGCFCWKTYYFVKINVFQKVPFQNVSWTDLGSIWPPERVP